MTSHALVHSLAQTWAQVGRSPVAALGDIAPNVGSVVSLEKEKERKPRAGVSVVRGTERGNRRAAGIFVGSRTRRSR